MQHVGGTTRVGWDSTEQREELGGPEAQAAGQRWSESDLSCKGPMGLVLDTGSPLCERLVKTNGESLGEGESETSPGVSWGVESPSPRYSGYGCCQVGPANVLSQFRDKRGSGHGDSPTHQHGWSGEGSASRGQALGGSA